MILSQPVRRAEYSKYNSYFSTSQQVAPQRRIQLRNTALRFVTLHIALSCPIQISSLLFDLSCTGGLSNYRLSSAKETGTGGHATEGKDSAGGAAKAKKEFPEAPDPGLGMQDERGGRGG